MRKKIVLFSAGVGILAACMADSTKTVDKKEAVAKKATVAESESADKWAFLPEVIATVGDQKITKEQFVKDIEAKLKGAPKKVSQEQLKQGVPFIVKEMVDRMIRLKLAEKAGINPSRKDAEAQLDKYLKEMPQEHKEQFEQTLKAQKMTVQDWKNKIAGNKLAQEDMAVDKWINKDILPKVEVTEADAKKFYEENKQTQFHNPEQVKASHILIKPEKETKEAKADAKKKAEEILQKIKDKKETFEQLAEKESACPSAAKKGDLGYFSRNRMVKEFEDTAFGMKPGEMSGLVETKFGYHIIKVTDKKSAEDIPFTEVKSFIEQRLKAQKVREKVNELINREKAELKVKINV